MGTVLAIRHAKIEHAGMLGEVLSEKGHKICYLDTPINQSLEEPLENYSLMLVLGGYMGAYEESKYPFLSYEFKLIEYALKLNLPIIGICLGSQMLAKVLGAKVYKGPKNEIGFYEVKKIQEHPYFSGFPQSLNVFQWHNDTFDLPNRSQRVFSSQNYENQGFIYNKAIGLQFHFEVSETMVKEWLIENAKEIYSEGIDSNKMLSQASFYAPELKRLVVSFVSNLFP